MTATLFLKKTCLIFVPWSACLLLYPLPRFLCLLTWKHCLSFVVRIFCLCNCANKCYCTNFQPWDVCPPVVQICCVSFVALPLLRNYSSAFSPPLSICSWKNEWPFPLFSSFNLTLSDFWEIPKSNGWDSFRSRAEIKCSFKSHFLFFNSPHFNKDPLDHLFPKSLFLSNFTLTLLKSL